MSNTTVKDPVLRQRGITEGNIPVPVGKLNSTVTQVEDGIILSVEVPGVDPTTIDLEEKSDALLITCPRGELAYPIEASLDQGQLEATVKWGLLELFIPRRQARAVKIKILEK